MTKEKKQEKTSERTEAENIEKTVVDLAKKGKSPSEIGIILKEKHGVKKIKVLGKSITKILEKNKISHDNDLAVINKKIENLQAHYAKNKQDKRAKREIVRFIGLRRKLEKYGKKKKNS